MAKEEKVFKTKSTQIITPEIKWILFSKIRQLKHSIRLDQQVALDETGEETHVKCSNGTSNSDWCGHFSKQVTNVTRVRIKLLSHNQTKDSVSSRNVDKNLLYYILNSTRSIIKNYRSIVYRALFGKPLNRPCSFHLKS